jgi:hypothetical protein
MWLFSLIAGSSGIRLSGLHFDCDSGESDLAEIHLTWEELVT